MEDNQPGNPDTTSASEPLAGVESIAKQVASDAQRNVPAASKPVDTPAPAADGRVKNIPAKFLKMPAALFMHGEDGKPILKRGKPVYINRTGGRPRKPREGEKLMDGSTFKGGDRTSKPNVKPSSGDGQASGVSDRPGIGRIVDPTQPVPGASSASAPAESAPGTVELGPEAGQVIAEAALNTAEAVVGEPPTSAERDSITKSASAVASGWRLHPIIAVAAFTAVYIGRVMMMKWSKQQEEKSDAHGDTRADGGRKDQPSKKSFDYGE